MSASELECDGYYQYPGQAAREAARITFRDASLTLRLDAGERLFTLSQLEIRPAPEGVPQAITFPDGGRFMPANPAAFRHWYENRHRKPPLINALERRKSGIAAALIGTLLTAVFYVAVLLPWLSETIAYHLPVAVEQQLGEVSEQLLVEQGFSNSSLSAARQAQLQALFSAVTPAEMRDKGGLRLLIMHFPEGANALMLPNGTMILSDELVALAKSDDALAAVMLHEMGHYRYRHSLQMLVRSSLMTLSMMLVVGDVDGIGDTLLQSAVFVNEMRFSRGMENEADEFAIAEMKQQGRSLQGMVQIFAALKDEHPDDDGLTMPDWLSTHPNMEARLERIREASGG